MSEEWGPWVEHDGAGVSVPPGARLDVVFRWPGITPGDDETVDVESYPGFFWRWKRVKTGWFSSELRRVCDDPTYAPVIRYRIRKPRGLVILERLIADLPQPVAVEVDA